ncbi:MAG: SDR family oxidoreductase [Planctomycetes bacterium]|nr:SDR family oxidoreductase [Planctomycetota bacterium]
MIDLRNRVSLITGSSRGIGRTTALKLAEAGSDVIVNYVSSKKAAIETAKEIIRMGRQAWVVKADVSEEQDARELIGFIRREIGQLDNIVCNAATGGFRNLLDSETKHFEHAMATNVLSLVFLARAAKDLLVNRPYRSKVVAISSHGADIALPMYGLIGGSKAALESIARHLTLELGHLGVNINVVKAGLVKTDSTDRLPGSEEMFAGRVHKSMMGNRVLEAVDVANAVLFLCSSLSDLVQGEILTVDGGAAIHV